MKVESGKYYRDNQGEVHGPLYEYGGLFFVERGVWNPDGTPYIKATSKLVCEVKVEDVKPVSHTRVLYLYRHNSSGAISFVLSSSVVPNILYHTLIGKKEVTIKEGEGL